MLSNRWKRVISMLLVLALLIQVLPLAVWAEDGYPTDLSCDPQTGKSDLYEYTPFESGMAGTAYLNNYLGTLHVRRIDLSLAGERMPVSIEFYHDAVNSTTNNPYGSGWSVNYDQEIFYDEDAGQYAYLNENGTWIYFVSSESFDEDGFELWVENTEFGVGDTGFLLHRSSEYDYDEYNQIYLSSGDTEYRFSTNGHLISIQSGANQICIEHDSALNAIDYIDDPVGRRYDFNYSNGVLTSINCKDSDGNAITSNGTAVAVAYTITNGSLTTITHANGDTVTYSYDTAHRITSASNVDLCGYTFSYVNNSDIVESVTAKAAMGTDAEASGIVTYYEQPTDDAATITDEETQQLYTFDGCGRTLSCELRVATTEAAAQGLDDSGFECVYGMTFTYGYVTDEDGTVSNTVVDVGEYDSEGMIEENSENESTEESEEDETEPDPYTYTEDTYGNTLSETNTQGSLKQTTTYTYSADGNYLTSMTDADGNTVQYHYNADTGLLEYLIDANNVKTNYSYNAMRELRLVNLRASGVALVANSVSMTASYIYSQGRLEGLVYGAYTYQFTYDIWGNVTTVKMNGRSLVTYNYGDNAYKGQVQTLTYGNGQIVYYTYDALGRVVNIGYTNQPNRFTYVYDSDGELLAIEDSVMSQTTIYNDTGYQIRTLNGALIYSCSADEDGNTTESIGELEYQTTFNSDTNSTAIIGSDDATVMTASHAYDAFNRLENKLVTSGNTQVTRTYSYSTDRNGNTGNLVSSYSTSYVRGNSELTSMVFSYTYDGNGNITNVVRTESTDPLVPSPKPVVPEDEPVTMTLGDDRIVTSYAYDAAGQLIEVIDDESEKIYRYTYDNSGNIRSAKTYVYDDDGNEVLSENRTYNYTNGILTSYTNGTDTVQYVSDAMGNPIRIIGGNATKVLTWGEGRMLLGVKQNNSNYFQYSYDVDGLRTRATIINNGVTTTKQYVWGDNGLAGTIIDDDSGYTAVVPMYDSEGEAIGFAVQQMSNNMMPSAGDPQVYTYVKNLQGDVLRVLDSSGNVVVSYAYDPWGKPTVTGDEELAALNPCSYRGYDYDEETGFYYLQSRYYDPQIGRFINSDDTSYMGNASVILDYNIWGYCDNDPINYCDANGHSPLRWICASIGAIAGWYFGDYVAKLIGYKTQEQYWAIRAGVIIGGAVICWFAATRIVKIVVKYLTDNPNTIFKLVNKWSAKKFMTAMKFLGINPFTLTMDSTKFIAIARQFNTREITIGLNWAKQLYYRAKALGFKIVLDRPHGGFSWHIHLSGGNGRLRNLHIQITKAAWDYLWKLLN